MKRRLLLVLLVLLVLLPGADPALAQEEVPPGFELEKVEKLHLDLVDPAPDGLRVVDLYVRAESRWGVSVENLRPVDLEIRDQGERVDPDDVTLEILADSHRGASVVLAIDTSRTMKGEPFDRARDAALRFLERLSDIDQLAIVTFADEAQVLTDFGLPRSETRSRLDGVGVDPESLSTVLYDGVHRAIELVATRPDLPRRRFVIVFSDGRDSGSTRTLEEVIELGRGSDLVARVPVSSIGYARFGSDGLETLQTISRETAGEFFHATSTIHLASFFNEIRNQMLKSYIVRYPATMDGELHTVELTVEGLSDRRSAGYPEIAGPVWPWIAGGGGAAVLLAGLALALRRRAPAPGRLVFVGGERSGEAVDLMGAQIRIGALDENDLVIAAPTVSRHHAQIKSSASGIEIEDLGSSNGTYVNGAAVTSCALKPGDKLRIGDVELVYQR